MRGVKRGKHFLIAEPNVPDGRDAIDHALENGWLIVGFGVTDEFYAPYVLMQENMDVPHKMVRVGGSSEPGRVSPAVFQPGIERHEGHDE